MVDTAADMAGAGEEARAETTGEKVVSHRITVIGRMAAVITIAEEEVLQRAAAIVAGRRALLALAGDTIGVTATTESVMSAVGAAIVDAMGNDPEVGGQLRPLLMFTLTFRKPAGLTDREELVIQVIQPKNKRARNLCASGTASNGSTELLNSRKRLRRR